MDNMNIILYEDIKMSDIFSLENTNDLSKLVLGELKTDSVNKNDQKIIYLLEIKNQLNIDEILVGLFRKYDLEKKRAWVANRLYALSQANKIEKLKKKRGTYMLKN